VPTVPHQLSSSRAKGKGERAHNKNPQPRAATKPNCEKTQSRAARCCQEQGAHLSQGGRGGRVCVWWESLGRATFQRGMNTTT